MGYRYIGSKEKLANILIAEIRRVNKSAKHIVDLMAGTGLFALALKENDFKVTAVDVMSYSYHHLQVHLLLNSCPDFKRVKVLDNHRKSGLFEQHNYAALLNYLNHLKPVKGYFYNEFSPEGNPVNATRPRKYFTAENAKKIDAIRNEIAKMNAEKVISKIEHSLLIHDLIMATNDIANIAGTYGHYLSKFVKRAKEPLILKPHIFSSKSSCKENKVIKGYAEKVSKKIKADLCYIDPPYIKRQYAANYHILETLARGDQPEAIGESGLRPWRDQYSNFCTKTKIWDSWDKIFMGLKVDDFLISYSEDGLIPIDELMDFIGRYGKVSKKDIEYKRFKSNDSKKNPVLKEYVIHLKPY